jgi:hypothetical protein
VERDVICTAGRSQPRCGRRSQRSRRSPVGARAGSGGGCGRAADLAQVLDGRVGVCGVGVERLADPGLAGAIAQRFGQHGPVIPSTWRALGERERLAVDIERCLRSDPRVARVERFGSLANDPAIPDEFSELDLDVFASPGTTDLELARSIGAIVGEVAPIRASRTIWLREFAYVEAVWFEGFPPYWHADIRCRAATHTSDPAYGPEPMATRIGCWL